MKIPLYTILKLESIRKSFGPLRALKDVCLEISEGEIHGLLGENGAGKTTLMNVVFGFVRPDSGEVVFNNERVSRLTPQKAMSLGIGMVHQHFKLVEEFTVAENIALGSPDSRAILRGDYSEEFAEFLRQSGLEDQLNVPVFRLSVGVRQRIEIAKALFGGARLLILDEPTAVLTPAETTRLFESLRRLKSSGTTVIIITHKLKEALAITDRLTVLRAGRVVFSSDTSRVTEQEIAQAMVGQAPADTYIRQQSPGDSLVLQLNEVTYCPETGQGIRRFSLELKQGEILGIAGVDGNGQGALGDVISGVALPKQGSIVLNGYDISSFTVDQRLLQGLVHIPGDRQSEALALEFSLAENVLLGRWPQAEMRSGPFVFPSALRTTTQKIIDEYGIHGASPASSAASLSGGNQQRLVIGRQLQTKPKVILAINPTRGLDVGAIRYVHSRLLEHVARGGAVILISSDLDEVIALSDRVLAIYRGRVEAEFQQPVNRDAVGLAMAGGSQS